jgi:hypothetical protein
MCLLVMLRYFTPNARQYNVFMELVGFQCRCQVRRQGDKQACAVCPPVSIHSTKFYPFTSTWTRLVDPGRLLFFFSPLSQMFFILLIPSHGCGDSDTIAI